MLGMVEGDGVPPEPNPVAGPLMIRSTANVPGLGFGLTCDPIA
jgi:hypothetical protein